MGFFRGSGIKEYEAIAAKNSGNVAILLETRNGYSSPETRFVMIVSSPRRYAIKMNELDVFFKRAFDEKFPAKDEFTYCRYMPVNQEFDLLDDFIKLKSTGEKIMIKKLAFYSGLLDR